LTRCVPLANLAGDAGEKPSRSRRHSGRIGGISLTAADAMEARGSMQLKPITHAGIPAALKKAERYRLLNDSSAAESICLDIIEVDPSNQQALISLLLSITDQFAEEMSDGVRRARDVLPRLADPYKRAYYAGIICERRARAQLHRGALGSADVAAEWFRDAMRWYEQAEAIRPAGEDEAILRWNTCVRMLSRHERAPVAADYEPALED